MSSIIEKIDSYQIITNLLPGAFFGVMAEFFLGINITTGNLGEEILLYYFIGMIINRISSLIIKPILIRVKFIVEASYEEYVFAEKKDLKIDTLSSINNCFRSILTALILIPITKGTEVLAANVKWIEKGWKAGAIVFLIILFLFAYKKQTECVKNRVQTVNNHKTEKKQ